MKKSILIPVAVLAVSLVITAGSLSFLGPCVHEDGSYGTCHWAGQALLGAGGVLLVQSILVLISRDGKRRQGVFLAMLPVSALGILIPGTLMDLCRMATMRCRSVMQPSMRILFVLAALLSLAGFLTEHRKAEK